MRPVNGELYKILMQWQQQFEWMALLPAKNPQAVEIGKRRKTFLENIRNFVLRQKKQKKQPAAAQFCLVFEEHKKYICSQDDLLEEEQVWFCLIFHTFLFLCLL
jgi:hypothetical protein